MSQLFLRNEHKSSTLNTTIFLRNNFFPLNFPDNFLWQIISPEQSADALWGGRVSHPRAEMM